MKARHLQLTQLGLAVFAAAIVFAVPAAHAFTIDTNGMTNGNETPKFADPDEAIEQFGNGNAPIRPGSGTFHFEVKPFSGTDQRGWINPLSGTSTLRDNP
jgi:hypothetical protein